MTNVKDVLTQRDKENQGLKLTTQLHDVEKLHMHLARSIGALKLINFVHRVICYIYDSYSRNAVQY
jgi:hypothetical protein